jgi:hypothetical protein
MENISPYKKWVKAEQSEVWGGRDAMPSAPVALLDQKGGLGAALRAHQVLLHEVFLLDEHIRGERSEDEAVADVAVHHAKEERKRDDREQSGVCFAIPAVAVERCTLSAFRRSNNREHSDPHLGMPYVSTMP